MLLSAVSVLVVAQSSSEIPEGLMNNPVYRIIHTIKRLPCELRCFIVQVYKVTAFDDIAAASIQNRDPS